MFVHIWLAASRYMYVAKALSWLRATLRVDEKYAADPTSATYRTVSPRARVIHRIILLREAILCSMRPSKKRRTCKSASNHAK